MVANEMMCNVDGCTKPVRGKTGLCYAHYMRKYRYGSPTAERPKDRPHIDLTGRVFGDLTVVRYVSPGRWVCTCSCGATATPLTGDLNRGNAVSCGDRTAHQRRDVCGYFAAHNRVTSDKGKASTHECVDCGRPAAHWSYDHADPEVLIDSRLGIPYSMDPDHYQPRCVPCHKTYDLNR